MEPPRRAAELVRRRMGTIPGRRRAPATMHRRSLDPPRTDPTPIFELFRGNYGTELLDGGRRAFRRLRPARGGPLAGRRAPRRRSAWPSGRPSCCSTALRAIGLLAARRRRAGSA